ncbi:RNA polymerase-associated protein RapA [Streptomyces sp. ADI91-18]|uniref:helicase-related protein n=1 Tax=Streptomyces sp. ADI91-18 TaxID=1522755 RepID=UPI000F552A7B|nr:helicase-related protein [Streptomyces sp. ADI91-18]RPK49465.1 RNA polymerase-associated protein RapA [Streptomyces sp. ADI91-18]
MGIEEEGNTPRLGAPRVPHGGVRLEELTPGAQVSGLTAADPVTVIRADWRGSSAMEVVYRDGSGAFGSVFLYRDHEANLRLHEVTTRIGFTGDPAAFRLAAEALRLRMAGLFDPMLAVSTSDLEALPHQIRAVYGELLPRTPLRFLLADDPGAGKTIMAGLYVKELLLRGDLDRCLIVAPGSLVEQWQDELLEKFGLRFELLTRSLVDSTPDTSVFENHPRLIARMDQLSRSDELLEQLRHTDWDLVVVDEAHRMSAHWFGNELKTTRRYQLGQLLGSIARHFLLMTATPHAGKEDDFQLFLALLDSDRFEGKYREGVHTVDASGLMRRMVKEDLLTFEGKPLFPERRAYTVPYELSPAEHELYEAVTEYVRKEMNRADRLRAAGDGRRGNTVGFALTVLQRRLASSPEAILRSLERRRERLVRRHREMLTATTSRPESDESQIGRRFNGMNGDDDWQVRLDDLDSSERETLEEEVLDAATAARTAAELLLEIEQLGNLIQLATHVRLSGTDRKWTELRSLLQDDDEICDQFGNPRKIIIFTEHRDTLNYLVDRIRSLLGQNEAVQTIHGGVRRDERRRVQELFTQQRDVRVLVATDAAGEGLNLQRAHLMVNYDLPWNPNRLEQRFGRIHRIGQTEVCHLWNLVATDTREGAVFHRLLDKIEQQRVAYRGQIFDVLGEAFEDQPLHRLLMEAIRYGDQPEVRARLDQVIDHTVGEGLDELLAERALHSDLLSEMEVAETRLRLEEARARRLQPHYVEAFFRAAFSGLGGRLAKRETGRFEITNVPALLLNRSPSHTLAAPVLRRYDRVVFDRDMIRREGKAEAALLAPGHPLMDAVVDATIERHAGVLKAGSVLIDRADSGQEPRLLVALTQEITNGHPQSKVISKRFDFVELTPDGGAIPAGPAPYLDYDPPTADESGVVTQETTRLAVQPWLASGIEQTAMAWAADHAVHDHLRSVRDRILPEVRRTREQVQKRLSQEIDFWYARQLELLDAQDQGRKIKIRPETARRRAGDLEARLERRMRELDLDERLLPRPPRVAGGALVLPQGLIDHLMGRSHQAETRETARDTAAIERRAVTAVIQAERDLGRSPEEMPPNNKGFDLRSWTADREDLLHLEVKGRVAGAPDFTVTRNEVLHAKNVGDRYRLALVSVSPRGPQFDEVRYLTKPFSGTSTDDFNVTKFVFHWKRMWEQGGLPH